MALIATILFLLVVPGRKVIGLPPEADRYGRCYEHGWPWTFEWRESIINPGRNAKISSCWSLREGNPRLIWSAVALDLAVMAIILAACGFAWERGRRQGKAWHQFGLGTFLIALTACSIACASVIQSTKSRQREAAALAPWGGSHDDRGMRVEMRPTALTWLRELVGDNYLQDWDRVVHFGCAIDAESIKTCQELDCLKVLHVYSDVDPEILSKVSPNLEQLEIHHPINLSPLSRFKSLKILRIQGNFKQSELPLTAELSRLEVLAISGRWMTDDQVAAIAQLPSLKKLWLTRTNISDASIEQLAKLTSLRKLHLYETHMTSRGIEGLRAALPGTAISLGDEKK